MHEQALEKINQKRLSKTGELKLAKASPPSKAGKHSFLSRGGFEGLCGYNLLSADPLLAFNFESLCQPESRGFCSPTERDFLSSFPPDTFSTAENFSENYPLPCPGLQSMTTRSRADPQALDSRTVSLKYPNRGLLAL